MNDLRTLAARMITAGPAGRLFVGICVLLSLYMPASLALASSLSADVRDRAQQLAELTPWGQPRSRQYHPHPLGVQTLSVEKQESKNAPDTSLLRVYQFNYDLKQARMLTIDSADSRVLKTQLITSVHLPLNKSEVAHAGQLLSAQESVMTQLRNEQIKRGLIAFDTLAELDVKASIYEPSGTSHPCRVQRCVLMSLFDDTRTVFSVEPVINLQSLQVDLLGL